MSLFVTFEGPDGSGKSTQIERLAQVLRGQGRSILTLREPGSTRIGNGVRKLIMNRDHTEMDPRTETLLFSAARAQLVSEVIRPALAAGEIVLCDRYADSSIAYQGYGHRQDLKQIHALIDYATGGLRPDLTIYLDLSPEDGLRRKQDGQQEWNRLDAQELAFHNRVRAGYEQMVAQEPDRWARIDGSGSESQVHRAILEAVQLRLPQGMEHSP